MRSFLKTKVAKIFVTFAVVCLAWTTSVNTKKFFRMSPQVMKSARTTCAPCAEFSEETEESSVEATRAARIDAPDAGSIVTCPSSCDLSGIEDCMCSIKEDLRRTLTMLDGGGQVICPDELTCTDDVNAAIYSITSWLKTLYAYDRGWFCDDTCP